MTWLKRIALFVVSALFAGAIYFKGQMDGWFLEKKTAEQVSQIIEPHLEVFRPPGKGPFKTILMFHGCGGDQEQQRYWGEVFKSWGYAAVYVNSYAGRGIDYQRAHDRVCQGRELLGGERAIDVHASLAWVKKQPWSSNRDVVLAGWSHGAWSIMDAFALQTKGRQANGVAGSFDTDLSLIQGVILFYAYCGLGSQTSSVGWSSKPNVLAIDVAEDSVVGTRVCDDSLNWIRASGSAVQHEVLLGVDHAFDAEALSKKVKDKYLTPKHLGLEAIDKVKNVLREFLR